MGRSLDIDATRRMATVLLKSFRNPLATSSMHASVGDQYGIRFPKAGTPMRSEPRLYESASKGARFLDLSFRNSAEHRRHLKPVHARTQLAAIVGGGQRDQNTGWRDSVEGRRVIRLAPGHRGAVPDGRDLPACAC